MFQSMASIFSSLLLHIFTYHFTLWKLVDENSIVSSYMGTNAIANVGISLVIVGKRNQNVWTKSLCIWDCVDEKISTTSLNSV